MIDFVHPATKHDDPVVTLHSLLDRDVYRGGAIVVGPVRRGRARRVRVERRVLPVTPDPERRAEVFERELWRIAVENLDYGEQHVWAALAGARVAPNGWRRAKAMLHFDRQGELKRRFLLTTVQRNRSAQLRLRALQEIAASRDAEAFDSAINIMGGWPRDERREGVKIMCRRSPSGGSAAGTRPTPGSGGWPSTPARSTRSTRCSAGPRPNGCWVCSSTPPAPPTPASAPARARLPQGGPPAECGAAGRGARPHARGRGGAARRSHPHGPKPAALARELLRNFPKSRRGSSAAGASQTARHRPSRPRRSRPR